MSTTDSPGMEQRPESQPSALSLAAASGECASGQKPSGWSLGSLLPWTLVIWGVLDFALRFGPLEWLDLDPVQIAQRTPERYSPFKANLKLMGRYVGTEARLANVRPQEFRDPVMFTTDSLGFRLSDFAAGDKAAVMVFGGFSFTFGSWLSDHETFPSTLGSRLGVRTYNAGRFQRDPETSEELDWLLNRLGQTVRTAVYVYADAAPIKPEGRPSGSPPPDTQRLYSYARRYVRGWRLISPVKILSIRFHKAMADGGLLPNESNDKVVTAYLPNGARVLFWKHEIEEWHAPNVQSAPGQAEYIAWWRDELQRRNIEMSVLLVPTKTEVYGPLLLGAQGPAGSGSFLNVLESELKRRGLPVVNGLTELRASADLDIREGVLSYYREDSHWNPRGVSRLATAVASLLRNNGWQRSASEITSVLNRDRTAR